MQEHSSKIDLQGLIEESPAVGDKGIWGGALADSNAAKLPEMENFSTFTPYVNNYPEFI